MKKGKRWLALLLSALLITGSVTGPVFASETDIADQTSEVVEVENPEGSAPEEDASADEIVKEDSFGDVVLEEDSAFGEGGESVQEEPALSEEPAEAESFEEAPALSEEPAEAESAEQAPVLSEEPQETDTAVEAPAFAEDSAQGEEIEDSAQDGEFEDSVLPEEPADSALPDEIVEEPETQEEEVSEEPQQEDIQIDYDEEIHTLIPDADLPSSDELFAGFVNSEFGISSGNRKLRKSSMGSRLTGIEKTIYDCISEELPQIAEGTRSSTVFEISVEELGLGQTSWTAEELGVDAIIVGGQIAQEAVDAVCAKVENDDDAVVRALLADNPYLLYWFDKTKGWSVSSPSISANSREIQLVGSITYSFFVSQEYAGAEAYTVDTSIGAIVVTAAQNAAGIVDSYSGSSDYDKLRGYMETICDLVSYNHDAADDPDMPYGNPWQMIWVFDGDPNTGVVCEGYSKAFQYLCDKTFFIDNISCYSVSGTMGGGTGAGPHMWNIVTMDDGLNYLVDVTNCDDGSVGQGGRLFLTGTEGSVDQGYIFVIDDDNYVSYTYKQETIDLYTESILSLASEDYTVRPRIDDAEIHLGATDYVYDGTPQEPAVFVIYNGTQLMRDTDYEVEYFDNTNAGQATVIVHGIGDYAGAVETTFTIHKADQTITASDLSLTYPESGTIEVSGNEGELSYSSSNSNVAEVDGSGNVTAIGAGNATIAITSAETDNYNAASIEIAVTVAKGAQTITAADLSLTYPESGKITVSGNEGELTYTSDNQDVAEVDESGNVTAKGAGTATITITAAATENYNAASKEIAVTVAKGTQTITASDLSLTLPGSGSIDVSGNEGELSFTSSDTSVAEVDNSGNVTTKGTGTATITITAAATDNYNEAEKQITVTVGKGAQTITASDLSLTYPESGTIEVSGNQGELTYTSSNPEIAEVDDSGNVTAKGVGTATITITAAATESYGAATNEITVTVAKGTQTITASDLSLTYSQSRTITVSGNEGGLSFTSSDTNIAEVDTSGKVTARGAGTATITITAAATDNYNETTKDITVTVAKADQNISAPYEISLPYPGSTWIKVEGNEGELSFTSSDTSVVEVDNSGNVTLIGAGTATITITAAETANYNGESTQVTVKVNKGIQTIKASDLTLTYPESGTIEFSGNEGQLSFTSSNTNIAEVDRFSGKVTAKGVGTATITITAAATDNYEEATKDITVTVVKPAQTITASNLSLTYPESKTIKVSGNEGALSFTSSNPAIAEVDDSGNVTAKGVGTATITITAAATANCNAATKQITVTVAKGTQTIAASNLSLTYPESGTIEVSGNEGDLSFASSNTSVAEVDATGKVTAKGAGTATITITAAATDNYSGAVKEITVTVAKADQTIIASDLSLVYPESKTIEVSGNEGRLSFYIDDSNVAEVDDSGNVTAKGVGTAHILINVAGTDNFKAAEKEITVTVAKGEQTITASDLTLDLGGEETIGVSGNKGDLSFTSSDSSIAEVNESGKVTAKGAGTVVITITAAATDKYNAAEIQITVTVSKPAQNMTVSDLSLTYPESGTIEVSGNEGDLSFSSLNTNIAEVDKHGKVTAKGAGKATITITAAATPDYRETVEEITVTIAKANQTITASDTLSLTFPNKGKITATASGSGSSLTYTSSNTAIATVDGSGNVTAKGAGKATITIKAAATANYNAASKQITVTVAKAAQNITTKAKASSVAVGKTVAVTTTGAQGKVTYKTSNTGIATVNATTGVVTAKKVGTVKITAATAATSNYNAASKTVTIKVVPAATTSLKADNMAKGIKVTWARVTGANGYDIYRNNKKVKTITSGTTVTWTDTAANTNNTKYVYKVVAKASTGVSTLSKSLTTYKVTAPTNRSAVNSASRKAVLTWTRNASATGYQVQYSLASNFSGAKTVTITKNTTLTTTVSSLTKGKTYYTRIRAYKTVGSNKYYSNWSAARSVKISK